MTMREYVEVGRPQHGAHSCRRRGYDDAATCDTYDVKVGASKYLHAIRDGTVPIERQFSGTVFSSGNDGSLRTERLLWDTETQYPLPAPVWHDVMGTYFPQAACLRVAHEMFDRLDAYRMDHSLSGWDAVIESLLGRRDA